jgi:Flp pilus assembly protein TadD
VEDHSHRSVAALIQTCLESPRVKKAIEVLERVVEQGKDSSNLLMTLGQLHVRAGQVELGNELIRKASEMDANATGKPGAA